MLNIAFVDSDSAHVCELQLIHTKLMLARKGMAGHNDYVAFRSAAELVAAIRWHQSEARRAGRMWPPNTTEV